MTPLFFFQRYLQMSRLWNTSGACVFASLRPEDLAQLRGTENLMYSFMNARVYEETISRCTYHLHDTVVNANIPKSFSQKHNLSIAGSLPLWCHTQANLLSSWFSTRCSQFLWKPNPRPFDTLFRQFSGYRVGIAPHCEPWAVRRVKEASHKLNRQRQVKTICNPAFAEAPITCHRWSGSLDNTTRDSYLDPSLIQVTSGDAFVTYILPRPLHHLESLQPWTPNGIRPSRTVQ